MKLHARLEAWKGRSVSGYCNGGLTGQWHSSHKVFTVTFLAAKFECTLPALVGTGILPGTQLHFGVAGLALKLPESKDPKAGSQSH